jgi:hypothetical protein
MYHMSQKSPNTQHSHNKGINKETQQTSALESNGSNLHYLYVVTFIRLQGECTELLQNRVQWRDYLASRFFVRWQFLDRVTGTQN